MAFLFQNCTKHVLLIQIEKLLGKSDEKCWRKAAKPAVFWLPFHKMKKFFAAQPDEANVSIDDGDPNRLVPVPDLFLFTKKIKDMGFEMNDEIIVDVPPYKLQKDENEFCHFEIGDIVDIEKKACCDLYFV